MIEDLFNSLNNYKNPDKEIIKCRDLFNLPISYINDKYLIQENIITDLELLPEKNQNSLYNDVFNPDSKDSAKIIPMWSKYYTDNTSFLKDSQ